jgi:hypothetical protein
MYNGERENKSISPEIHRAQQLRSQVAQIEKSYLFSYR